MLPKHAHTIACTHAIACSAHCSAGPCYHLRGQGQGAELKVDHTAAPGPKATLATIAQSLSPSLGLETGCQCDSGFVATMFR